VQRRALAPVVLPGLDEPQPRAVRQLDRAQLAQRLLPPLSGGPVGHLEARLPGPRVHAVRRLVEGPAAVVHGVVDADGAAQGRLGRARLPDLQVGLELARRAVGEGEQAEVGGLHAEAQRARVAAPVGESTEGLEPSPAAEPRRRPARPTGGTMPPRRITRSAVRHVRASAKRPRGEEVHRAPVALDEVRREASLLIALETCSAPVVARAAARKR
jgi:hypothetical protein